MAAHYIQDTARLGIGRPPRAPRERDDRAIVELIRALVDRDHAYAVNGDVYFRVRSPESTAP